MGDWDDWPEFSPDVELHVQISSGSLDLLNTSKLLNTERFTFDPPDIHATVWKNGSKVSHIQIDSSDGTLSLPASITVTSGDKIEFRFQYVGGQHDSPWYPKVLWRRSAFLTVPTGNATIDFDSSHNTMPIPNLDLAFGWDSSGHLKLGFKVSNDGGASQDLSVYTRMLGSGTEALHSTTVDLDSSTAQYHVSTFKRGDVEAACELETKLVSSTASTHQEDRFRLVFFKLDEVPSFPTGFPDSGAMLREDKPAGASAARLSKLV